LFACAWCYIGRLDRDLPATWIYRETLQNSTPSEIYLTAVYYCLSTLTTVGYGDIFAYTDEEMVLTSCLMMYAVLFYSFIIGIISSFFATKESKASL